MSEVRVLADVGSALPGSQTAPFSLCPQSRGSSGPSAPPWGPTLRPHVKLINPQRPRPQIQWQRGSGLRHTTLGTQTFSPHLGHDMAELSSCDH